MSQTDMRYLSALSAQAGKRAYATILSGNRLRFILWLTHCDIKHLSAISAQGATCSINFPMKTKIDVLFCSVFCLEIFLGVLFCSVFCRTEQNRTNLQNMFCVLSSLVGINMWNKMNTVTCHYEKLFSQNIIWHKNYALL